MSFPAAVAELLREPAAAGGMVPMFPLLTVGADGDVHVCLLSAAQCTVDNGELRAAVHARRTSADLARDGRGTLLIVGREDLHVVRLRVNRLTRVGVVTAVALDVQGHEATTAGVQLAPMAFAVTSELVERERWSESTAALATLAQETR